MWSIYRLRLSISFMQIGEVNLVLFALWTAIGIVRLCLMIKKLKASSAHKKFWIKSENSVETILQKVLSLKSCKKILIQSLCGNSSVVEHLVANEKVAGSNPVSRSLKPPSELPDWRLLFVPLLLGGDSLQQLPQAEVGCVGHGACRRFYSYSQKKPARDLLKHCFAIDFRSIPSLKGEAQTSPSQKIGTKYGSGREQTSRCLYECQE